MCSPILGGLSGMGVKKGAAAALGGVTGLLLAGGKKSDAMASGGSPDIPSTTFRAQ